MAYFSLTFMSKIFERLLESQAKTYINSLLNPLICGFREGHSTKHALLRLVENCKKALDQKMNKRAIVKVIGSKMNRGILVIKCFRDLVFDHCYSILTLTTCLCLYLTV